MTEYRNALPQLGGELFLSDGGLETTLIFHGGFELPDFAAFPLLKSPSGEAALRNYFQSYADIATRHRTGLILESATWRASADWGARLGYSPDELAEANRLAIALLEDIRNEVENDQTKLVISGCIGPRGDGYVPTETMSGHAAEAYHTAQIETFDQTAADMVCAITMNYVEEAIGISRAAQRAGIPVAISFTGRDRWPAADRPDATERDRAGRPGHGRLPQLLHDQLRAPDPLCARAGRSSAVRPQNSRSARQCFTHEPCRVE